MTGFASGWRWQARALTLAAMLTAASPGVAEEIYPPDRMLYMNVMPHACPMAEYLGYEKIDGEWVGGGRSVFRGELPVVGPVSEMLVDSTLARSGLVTFDAQRFRYLHGQLNIVAKVFETDRLPDPDMLNGEDMIGFIDQTVAQLLKDWRGADPWTLCGEVDEWLWREFRESR